MRSIIATIIGVSFRRNRIRKRVRRRVEELRPTPNNCHECGRTCTAWHYGGRGCVYEKEINDTQKEE